jgi:hypothetical protein
MNHILFLAQTSSNGDEFSGALASIVVTMFVMVGVVIAVAIWQGMATWRARMHIAREEAYRKLAESSEAANSRTADLLASMKNDLADLRARTAEIERMMKEVG